DPAHRSTNPTSLRAQLPVQTNPPVRRYSQYYSVVFGGNVGLSLWLTQYYDGEYGYGIQSAANLAATNSLPGGVQRANAGW
ncbi:MFS transporter, partial [Burkholderia pseudomallei]